MEISNVVMEKAKEIVCDKANKLPALVSDEPQIYVAKMEDASVLSQTTVECHGIFFKVGPLKRKMGALT